MNNEWLEKSEKRYNVSVAGLELEALIQQVQALQQTLNGVRGVCEGIQRNVEEIKRIADDPKQREEVLERMPRCAEAVRKAVLELQDRFNDVLQKLVDKRGKWVR